MLFTPAAAGAARPLFRDPPLPLPFDAGLLGRDGLEGRLGLLGLDACLAAAPVFVDRVTVRVERTVSVRDDARRLAPEAFPLAPALPFALDALPFAGAALSFAPDALLFVPELAACALARVPREAGLAACAPRARREAGLADRALDEPARFRAGVEALEPL